ncbi:MAG: MATE family efflux transporter, partial [Lachnospiraceae bacterium]|nr:MATE family efflux transporter [Lachnospiraceae bacterium]
MKKIELSEHFTYKKLLLYSLPVMLTTIASMSFMMVDGYFVSNFLGVDALAAVDLVSPVYFAVYSIGIMLGAGGSALIAKHKGASDVDAARKCFTMLVALAVLFGIIIAPIIIFFMDDLLRLQGADDSILP